MLFFLFTLTSEDQKLIDMLFLQQHKKLYGLSYRILGSQQDAEDAISDAFLKIIGHLEKIKDLPCHKTVPYCVVIVRHCAITILRRRKKVIHVEQAESIATDDLPIEDGYFKQVDATVLAELMGKLSTIDSQLLRLHYMDEMSYHEIGKLLGITEVAARKREQRALQRLRRLYGMKNEE